LVVPLLQEFSIILDVSRDDASWPVTAALLTTAAATPIMSSPADVFAKRLMMLVCMVAKAVGSMIAAVGAVFVTAIIGCSLQGFAGAMIPIAISIIRDELPNAYARKVVLDVRSAVVDVEAPSRPGSGSPSARRWAAGCAGVGVESNCQAQPLVLVTRG
jgi:MFS family permease